MREVNFIEDKGRFGITFMSDDKAEANTVMNAIQRFISKNSNINNLDVNSIREKIYRENIDSLLDSIEKIKKRRDLSELTYYELEYIALMEKEIVVMKEKLSMDKYTETAQPILNKMLETFTMEDLDKLKETTLLDEKYIEEEIQKRLDNKSYSQDYSRNPLDGPSKGVYFNLYPDDRLIELYNNEELEQGYKDYIKKELNRRGIFDLSMTKSKKKSSNNTKNVEKSNTIIENIKEHELNKKIETIKNGRDMTQLSDEELEKISLLESELASICKYSETAKHILQGRKFNRSRELENKITQGRRLSELTLEELKELEKVTMLDNYKEDIQKEINKRENKSFEETLEDDNGIISFGEDDSNYRIDEECEEDPLTADENHINKWDFDADGDKVDSEGNKMLFADEE
ncbi:hypothetical protein [Brachyspira alvinipulli]|uniref:hypothetical protein n=1 Tax=Brachyspira alvinipulli TaxID=84379 RepID=UPI0004827D52|nr:hypothetical protein [Brachyspira alvinipulli]